MNALLRMLARLVRRAPLAVVLVIVALTVVFGGFAGQQRTDDSFDSFASDGEVAVTQAAIAERFDGGSTASLAQLVVVDPDGDVLSPEGVRLVQDVVETVSADPGFLAVAQPLGPGSPATTSYASPVLGAAAQQGIDIATLSDDGLDRLYDEVVAQLPDAQAAQLSLLLGGEVEGADATAGMILFSLDGSADDADLAAAREVINAQAGTIASFEVYSFDLEALNAEVNGSIQSEMGRLLGIAFLLIVLILVAVYRSAIDVIASLLGLVFAIVWSQGGATLLGPDHLGLTGPMSQMGMIIPILLVGLGVDYGIHLTMRTREERTRGVPVDEAGGQAIRTVGAALVLATVTTVVGFMTNISNPLPPLKDFGLFAAFGVVSAFLVMTTFVPAVRLLADRAAARRGRDATAPVETEPVGVGALGRLAAAFAPTAVRRPGSVLGVAALLTVAGGFGATQLSTEFSQTDFFPEGSRALETVEVITDAFGGGFDETTSVLVEGDIATAQGWNALMVYQQGFGSVDGVRSFEGRPQVDSVVSRAAQAGLLSGPVADDAAAVALLDTLEAADPSVGQLVTADRDATVFRAKTSVGETVAPLAADLERLEAETLAPAGLAAAAASDDLLVDEILSQLQASQINGLIITIVASMLILAIAFWVRQRAPMLGVIAIAAVAVATAWVLGLMALFGIPFNVMTAMVSALAIGIGVPFGIHVVNRFIEDRANEPDTLSAMRHTLEHTGGALVGSAVTTIAGFGVLVFASVPPMRQFGTVTAITIGLALVSSLVVLPAMLALWDRTRTRSLSAPTRSDRSADESEHAFAG